MGITLQLPVVPAVAAITINGSTATVPEPLDGPPSPHPTASPDIRNEGTNITIGPDEIRAADRGPGLGGRRTTFRDQPCAGTGAWADLTRDDRGRRRNALRF